MFPFFSGARPKAIRAIFQPAAWTFSSWEPVNYDEPVHLDYVGGTHELLPWGCNGGTREDL
jgi:hypothetical protein